MPDSHEESDDEANGQRPVNNVLMTIVHPGISQDPEAMSSNNNDNRALTTGINNTRLQNSEPGARVSRSLNATTAIDHAANPKSCNSGEITLSPTQDYSLHHEGCTTRPTRSMVIVSMNRDGTKNYGRFTNERICNGEMRVATCPGFGNRKSCSPRINLSNNKVAPCDIQQIDPKSQIVTIPEGGESSQAHQILSTTSYDSMADVCRICHDNPSKILLMMPCRCKGSMGMVHLMCLERWLSESGKNTCEICGFEYNTIRKPKYTGCSAMFAWIRKPITPNDTRNLFFDIACFFILTPLAAVSSWLCVNGAQTYTLDHHFYEKKIFEKNDPSNSTWTAIGLLFLTGTLVVAYLVWFFIAIRYHRNVFHEWQLRNFIVSIVPFDGSQNIQIQSAVEPVADVRYIPHVAEQANNNENSSPASQMSSVSFSRLCVEDEMVFASVYERDSVDRIFGGSVILPEIHTYRATSAPNSNLDQSTAGPGQSNSNSSNV